MLWPILAARAFCHKNGFALSHFKITGASLLLCHVSPRQNLLKMPKTPHADILLIETAISYTGLINTVILTRPHIHCPQAR